MVSKEERILVTDSDLDGLGIYVLYLYFQLGEFYFDKIINLTYEQLELEETKKILSPYKEIYFTDLSPSKFLYDWMVEENKYFEVYDHHDSSEWLKGIDYKECKVYHDKEECGASLFYKKFIKPSYPRIKAVVSRFVELVWTYDTWRKDSKDWDEAQNLNRLLYYTKVWDKEDFYGSNELFFNLMLTKFEKLDTWKWTRFEQDKIMNAIRKESQAYQEARKILQIRVDTKGRRFGLFHSKSKISYICSRLLDESHDLQYVVAINTYDESIPKISYRSRDENGMDCTTAYFVKGHKCAAGGELPSFQYQNDFWKGKINSLPYMDEMEENNG